MKRGLLAIVTAFLLLAGCGRQEMPQSSAVEREEQVGQYRLLTVRTDGDGSALLLYDTESGTLVDTFTGASAAWYDGGPLTQLTLLPDIMGYRGCRTERQSTPHHYISRYYAWTPDGAVPIGESWYFRDDGTDAAIDDHVTDIDGDGVTELVCNTVTGGDGHEEAIVYRRTAQGIERGIVDREKADMPGFTDGGGANASQTRFDAHTGRFTVRYDTAGGQRQGEVGAEALTFAPAAFDGKG